MMILWNLTIMIVVSKRKRPNELVITMDNQIERALGKPKSHSLLLIRKISSGPKMKVSVKRSTASSLTTLLIRKRTS